MKSFFCNVAGGICLSTAVLATFGLMATPVVFVACALGAVAWFAAPHVLRRR